jgi:hypothetical protein
MTRYINSILLILAIVAAFPKQLSAADTIRELEQKIQTLRSQIEPLAQPWLQRTSVRVDLGLGPVEDFFTFLSTKRPKVRLQIVEQVGQLAGASGSCFGYEHWTAFVELINPQNLAFTLTLSNLSARWDPTVGLRVHADNHLDARTIHLRLYLDPCIGGGGEVGQIGPAACVVDGGVDAVGSISAGTGEVLAYAANANITQNLNCKFNLGELGEYLGADLTIAFPVRMDRALASDIGGPFNRKGEVQIKNGQINVRRCYEVGIANAAVQKEQNGVVLQANASIAWPACPPAAP